jgi:hypothetical protein
MVSTLYASYDLYVRDVSAYSRSFTHSVVVYTRHVNKFIMTALAHAVQFSVQFNIQLVQLVQFYANYINMSLHYDNIDAHLAHIHYFILKMNDFIVKTNTQCQIFMNTYGYVIAIVALMMYGMHRAWPTSTKVKAKEAITIQPIQCKTYVDEGTQTCKTYTGVMTRSMWI